MHFDFEIYFAPQRRATFHRSSGHMAPQPATLASLLFDRQEPEIIRKHCVSRFFSFRAPAPFSAMYSKEHILHQKFIVKYENKKHVLFK